MKLHYSALAAVFAIHAGPALAFTCDSYADALEGMTCGAFMEQFHIPAYDFYRWNPGLQGADGCRNGNLKAGQQYCIKGTVSDEDRLKDAMSNVLDWAAHVTPAPTPTPTPTPTPAAENPPAVTPPPKGVCPAGGNCWAAGFINEQARTVGGRGEEWCKAYLATPRSELSNYTPLFRTICNEDQIVNNCRCWTEGTKFAGATQTPWLHS